MTNFSKCFTSAFFLLFLLASPGCSSPEYPPTATPQLKPITPAARQDLPESWPRPGRPGEPGNGFANWSAPEREAALFIQNAAIYFYYDSAVLTDSAKAVLNQKAEVIKANPQLLVTIGGHCDERGTEAYNYALGGRRSKAARDYLVQRGVPAAQLGVASYGKANPAAPGKGEAAWSQNRRADFAVGRR